MMNRAWENVEDRGPTGEWLNTLGDVPIIYSAFGIVKEVMSSEEIVSNEAV